MSCKGITTRSAATSAEPFSYPDAGCPHRSRWMFGGPACSERGKILVFELQARERQTSRKTGTFARQLEYKPKAKPSVKMGLVLSEAYQTVNRQNESSFWLLGRLNLNRSLALQIEVKLRIHGRTSKSSSPRSNITLVSLVFDVVPYGCI
jgi:hypothetical protein